MPVLCASELPQIRQVLECCRQRLEWSVLRVLALYLFKLFLSDSLPRNRPETRRYRRGAGLPCARVSQGGTPHELSHKPQLDRIEVDQVGENIGLQVRIGNAEPRSQSGSVLIERGGGNPAPTGRPGGAGIIGSRDHKRGVGAIHIAAVHGAAHDHLMISPCMIAAEAGAGLQGATELGEGEGGDLGANTHFEGGVVKGAHGCAELRKKRALVAKLEVVSVKTAHGAKEN